MLKLTAEGRNFVRRKWALFMSYERARRSALSPREEHELIRLLQAFVGIDSSGGQPTSA
jgi:hypothetical protein